VALAQSTCWSLIDAAAKGSEAHRAAFVERYRPLVEAYFGARWRSSAHTTDVDDAIQDVFLQCFRAGGVLDRADQERPGGFRAFLYGVLRNIALKAESRRRPARLDTADAAALEADEDSLSRVYDRGWARMIVQEAADLMLASAATKDEDARKRVEILRLRFGEGLPIRDIAARWNVDAKLLHRQYPRAREEFVASLKEVLARHDPGAAGRIEQELSQLQNLLS
jgi:RNA polymerase sigma factor (sigma-70 family)